MRFSVSCPDCGLCVPYHAGVCPFCASRKPGFIKDNSPDFFQ